MHLSRCLPACSLLMFVCCLIAARVFAAGFDAKLALDGAALQNNAKALEVSRNASLDDKLSVNQAFDAGGPSQPLAATSNDDCANAMTITVPGTWTQNIADNTYNALDPAFSCQNFPSYGFTQSTWCTFTPSRDMTLTFSTCNTDGGMADTLLGVYTGSCGSFTEIACSDDACGAGFRLASRIDSLSVSAGTTYYIQCADWGQSSANVSSLVLDIFESASAPTENNTCDQAMVITEPGVYTLNVSQNTYNASDPAFPCQLNPQNGFTQSTWFAFQPASDGLVDISLCNTDNGYADTLLGVYTGRCGDMNVVACDEDGCSNGNGFGSVINNLSVNAGEIYYIQTADYGPNADTQNLVLEISSTSELSWPIPALSPWGAGLLGLLLLSALWFMRRRRTFRPTS